MNAEQNDDVIVFDNLVKPAEVVGKFEPIKAVEVQAETFINHNAAGNTRTVNNREEVGAIALDSGQRLKKIFAK